MSDVIRSVLFRILAFPFRLVGYYLGAFLRSYGLMPPPDQERDR